MWRVAVGQPLSLAAFPYTEALLRPHPAFVATSEGGKFYFFLQLERNRINWMLSGHLFCKNLTTASVSKVPFTPSHSLPLSLFDPISFASALTIITVHFLQPSLVVLFYYYYYSGLLPSPLFLFRRLFVILYLLVWEWGKKKKDWRPVDIKKTHTHTHSPSAFLKRKKRERKSCLFVCVEAVKGARLKEDTDKRKLKKKSWRQRGELVSVAAPGQWFSTKWIMTNE